jgi:hypothetical protein
LSGARPLNEWPLILCGPMLRRVTPDDVCVFIALRQPARVRLRLYTDADGSNPVSLTPPAAQTTLALGRRLHVVAARHRPLSALLPGLHYYYDLEITRLRDSIETSDTLRSLSDAPLAVGGEFASDGPNLLQGDFPLGYQAAKLPGFHLANDLDHLAILHASCRKAHGEGPDMLALADDVMVERAFSSERPHQMILTGDQIYADDVALSLAQIIAATAPELITADPALRVPELDAIGGDAAYHGELPDATAALDDDPYGRAMNDASLAPGERRALFATRLAGFSVERSHAAGHLLYLGEFYAMYLLAWSSALWPVDNAGEPQLAADPTLLSDDEDKRADFAAQAAEQEPRLQSFFHALPRVRRALANIPTLMMFDDHEVTDDWNMSAPTAERVLESRSGRQVVRNALTAYAVFQDWGNRPSVAAAGQPAAYEVDESGAAILEAVRCPSGASGPLHPPDALPPLLANGGSDARREIEDLFGLRRHIPPAPPTMDWHYCVHFPSHLLIALDTRTRRLLPADGGPAAIIDPAHMATQLDVPRNLYPDMPALIIAPGPVFDLPPTELLKDGIGQAVRITIGSSGGRGAVRIHRPRNLERSPRSATRHSRTPDSIWFSGTALRRHPLRLQQQYCSRERRRRARAHRPAVFERQPARRLEDPARDPRRNAHRQPEQSAAHRARR